MQFAPIVEPAKTIAPVEIDRAVADRRRRQRLALRGRGGAERRLLADDRVLEHAHVLAEHRALVDGRSRVDLSHRARVAVSISSARTTRAPSRATFDPVVLPVDQLEEVVHSSRSGSAVEIFGMEMSPERVCHSPYVSARFQGDFS